MPNDWTPNLCARVAGVMFLLGIGEYFAGGWFLSLSSASDAAGNHPLASQEAVRIGLLLRLAVSWGTIILIGALYTLLKPFSPPLALMALSWRLVEVVFATAATTLDPAGAGVTGSLGVATDASYLQLAGWGHSYFIHIAELFFAAGSAVYFFLLFKSNLIPRAISIVGVFGSCAILVHGISKLIIVSPPDYLDLATIPILLAELLAGAWLTVMGVRAVP